MLHPLPKGFDKSFEPLAPFGLSSGLVLSRYWRRDSEPKSDEQRQCLGGDALVSFEPRDLAREAVQAARQCGLLHVGMIRREEGLDGRLDDGGAGHPFAVGQIFDASDQVGWQGQVETVAHG